MKQHNKGVRNFSMPTLAKYDVAGTKTLESFGYNSTSKFMRHANRGIGAKEWYECQTKDNSIKHFYHCQG